MVSLRRTSHTHNNDMFTRKRTPHNSAAATIIACDKRWNIGPTKRTLKKPHTHTHRSKSINLFSFNKRVAHARIAFHLSSQRYAICINIVYSRVVLKTHIIILNWYDFIQFIFVSYYGWLNCFEINGAKILFDGGAGPKTWRSENNLHNGYKAVDKQETSEKGSVWALNWIIIMYLCMMMRMMERKEVMLIWKTSSLFLSLSLNLLFILNRMIAGQSKTASAKMPSGIGSDQCNFT